MGREMNEYDIRDEYLKKHHITYEDYLQSEHWQNIKAQRLALPECYCAVCGSTKSLNLHHMTYKNIGHEDLSDLQWLCYEHHGDVHAVNKRGWDFYESIAAVHWAYNEAKRDKAELHIIGNYFIIEFKNGNHRRCDFTKPGTGWIYSKEIP